MDPIRLTDYECCGDSLFDVIDVNLGSGPVSLCKETEAFLRDVVTVYKARPPRQYYKQRARIACVWCGACQVVKLTDEIAGTDKGDVFPVGKYRGQTPAEVFSSGQEGERYVRSCAEQHHVAKQHQLAKEFIDGRTSDDRVHGTGDPVAGGGGDDAVGGRPLKRLDNCGSPECGVLGIAEAATQAGWRVIGRLGAVTRGDQGGM